MQNFSQYTPDHSQQNSMLAGISSEAVYFQRIYSWMFAALGVTAAVATLLVITGMWSLFNGGMIWMVVAFAPLGLALYMNSRAESLSVGSLKICLMVFASLFGITLSVLFQFYPTVAFIKAFVTTAGVYGAMAAYGLVTKRSLQGIGSFMYMGVWGLIIASVVNFFWHNNMLDLTICVIGVLIFAALTAYDHQKLRVIYFQYQRDGAAAEYVSKGVIFGALTLYLDFINLFLFLLRLFGRGND